MGRLLSLAVLAVSSLAWAEGELAVEQPAPAPVVADAKHVLWLHTSFQTLTGAALAYEHWFNRSISMQLSLGGSYGHSRAVVLGGGFSQLGGIPLSSTDTLAVNTEVQLRYHLSFGVFFAESLGMQWQRTVATIDPTVGTGVFGTDATLGIESVLAGWGHRFESGLAVELYAGPLVSLSFAGPSATSMSANSVYAGFRYGVGVGYVF